MDPSATFDLLPGAKPPSYITMLRMAFEFAAARTKAGDDKTLRFGIFNADRQLALVCTMRGYGQANEFAAMVGKAGYKLVPPQPVDPSCDFLYEIGEAVPGEQTEPRRRGL